MASENIENRDDAILVPWWEKLEVYNTDEILWLRSTDSTIE